MARGAGAQEPSASAGAQRAASRGPLHGQLQRAVRAQARPQRRTHWRGAHVQRAGAAEANPGMRLERFQEFEKPRSIEEIHAARGSVEQPGEATRRHENPPAARPSHPPPG